MNISIRHCLVTIAFAAVVICDLCTASTSLPTSRPQKAKKPVRPPTLAVLEFQSDLKEPADSGRIISEILSARLSAVGAVTVVEREDIAKILAEHKLTLSGLVSDREAVKVGKLLGAQLLLTGRIATIGTNRYMICRVISAETSQVKGFALDFDANAALNDLLKKTTSKLSESLPGLIEVLIPKKKRGPTDVTILKKLLKGKAVPAVAVVIAEQHRGRPIIDPAVETEFKMLLTRIGIKPTALTAETARNVASNVNNYARVSQLLAGTRYLICGEAFSEPGGTVHGLSVGLARAEIQIIDLKSGKILFADRGKARAPDLAEHLAAKTALQKVGRKLAVKLLPKLIRQLPDAPKSSKDDKQPKRT